MFPCSPAQTRTEIPSVLAQHGAGGVADEGGSRVGTPSPAGVWGWQPHAREVTGDAPRDVQVGTGRARLAGFGCTGHASAGVPVSVPGWAGPCWERCGRPGCVPSPGCISACRRLAPNEDKWAG